MEAKARIIKNTLFLLAGNVIEQMISFVLVIAVARNLGDAGLGEYAFVFSFIWVVVILMNPGLDYLLLKEISRDEAKTSLYASNMLFIKLALGGMALVITFLITWFLPEKSRRQAIHRHCLDQLFSEWLRSHIFPDPPGKGAYGIQCHGKDRRAAHGFGPGVILSLQRILTPLVRLFVICIRFNPGWAFLFHLTKICQVEISLRLHDQ